MTFNLNAACQKLQCPTCSCPSSPTTCHCVLVSGERSAVCFSFLMLRAQPAVTSEQNKPRSSKLLVLICPVQAGSLRAGGNWLSLTVKLTGCCTWAPVVSPGLCLVTARSTLRGDACMVKAALTKCHPTVFQAVFMYQLQTKYLQSQVLWDYLGCGFEFPRRSLLKQETSVHPLPVEAGGRSIAQQTHLASAPGSMGSTLPFSPPHPLPRREQLWVLQGSWSDLFGCQNEAAQCVAWRG